MSETQQITKNKVPMGQKIAFGAGMLANQMFPATLGIFMIILIKDLGFSGMQYGLLFFIPRLFDAVTDPLMGFISDNTKSKWGRRRQYVFVGAIIMSVSFMIMWQLYSHNSVNYNFVYFLLWSLIHFLGLTIFSVPYVAMGYEMSTDFHERTRVMVVSQFIGQWAWVIAPWLWVVMYDKGWFPSSAEATRTLAVWVGGIFMIFAIVPALFIKGKPTLDEDYIPLTIKSIGKSFKQISSSFKEAIKIKAFNKLCISTFLVFNAFNTIAGFSFLIIVFYLFNGVTGDDGAWIWPTLFGCVGAIITSFMVIPIVGKMAKTLGKKKAFLISQGISIIGYILLWFLFIPGKPFTFLFALPFHSFGIGSLFTIMMSMTSDVIDLDELNTGKRREGVFGAIYWWMVKFGLAFAGLCSGFILDFVGYDSDAVVQTTESILGMRLFFSGLPIVGTLIAIYVMSSYDVTEASANKVRAELDNRKEALKA